jgi:hypothetical protein
MAANQPQAAWTERCPTLEERVHVDGAGTPRRLSILFSTVL